MPITQTYIPRPIVKKSGIVSLSDGGTGANTAPRAAKNLGMMLSSAADKGEGPVRIDPDTGKIDAKYFTGVADYRAEIDGPTTISPGSTQIYEITNFDSRNEYVVSATNGNVSISGDKITYTAPIDVSKVPEFTLNGEAWTLSFE